MLRRKMHQIWILWTGLTHKTSRVLIQAVTLGLPAYNQRTNTHQNETWILEGSFWWFYVVLFTAKRCYRNRIYLNVLAYGIALFLCSFLGGVLLLLVFFCLFCLLVFLTFKPFLIFLCLHLRMSFSSNLNHYGMVHMASVSDVLLDTSFTPPCQRMGAMVAFRSFQEFTKSVLV